MNLIALQGPSTKFSVLSCQPESLVVEGDFVENIAVGNNVIYLNIDTLSSNGCSNCSPLFRKIVMIADGTVDGTKVLTTTFLTLDALTDEGVSYDVSLADTQVELLFGCPHSGAQRFLQLDIHPPVTRSLQSGECAENWLQSTGGNINSCLYTNCVVQKTGDPAECFRFDPEYGYTNLCGAQGEFSWSGNALLFDFGNACCNHDFCWASTYGKEACDQIFLADMLSACPTSLANLFFGVVGIIKYFTETSSSRLGARVSDSIGVGAVRKLS